MRQVCEDTLWKNCDNLVWETNVAASVYQVCRGSSVRCAETLCSAAGRAHVVSAWLWLVVALFALYFARQ
jgi:hypothetical protein